MSTQSSASRFDKIKRKLFWLKTEIKENLFVSDKVAEDLLDVYTDFCISVGENMNTNFAVPKVIDDILHLHIVRTKSFQNFFKGEFCAHASHKSEVFGSTVFWSALNTTKEIFLPKVKYNKEISRSRIIESSGCYIVIRPCGMQLTSPQKFN